ncbi:amidohydrolase family protein [Bombardia bombarda]|uniref:Amidohydrolase family protein n=1 Tax=Bombardia bombarda TaxID=252184 RepID=A0AA39WH76_9PEZI|nr:amidohydrolase family protein [Bombardia bombarda]
MQLSNLRLALAALAVCCNTALAVETAAAPASTSKLLRGGTIIGFDEKTQLIKVTRNGSLLIQNDRITAISEANKALTNVPKDAEIIDCTNNIITPGFIDTHRHGWQTVFKTMGSNTTLGDQLAGIHEALYAGVTTILDHAHHTWTPEHSKAGLDASVDSGGRVFFAYTFQNSTDKFAVPQQLAQWKTLRKAMTSKLTTLVISYDDFTTNPTGSYTSDVVKLAKDNKIEVLTTHQVEGPWLLGNSPEDLHRVGILQSTVPVVISHASGLTARGAQLLRATNQHISITAESEMHYGHTHPTTHLILDQASLGIDTHFTFSTDILTQARIYLQSTRLRAYEETFARWEIPANNPMSVNQAFLLATRNGGLALNRTDLGVINVGAKADVLVWNGRSPALLGWDDPVAAVILHASIGDLSHVLVDGGFVKKDGKLVIKGYEDVQTRFLKAAAKIQGVLKSQPLPVQNGSWITGTQYAQLEQTDAQRGASNGYGPSYV